MDRTFSNLLLLMAFLGGCSRALTQTTEVQTAESRCLWTDFRKLECQVRSLAENFSWWISQESWPLTTNSTSSLMSSGLSSSSMISSSSLVTPQTSPHRYRDVTRATSLKVQCLPLLLESSISNSTFRGLEELTHLELVSCKLTSIPRDALVNLSQLRLLKVTSMNDEWLLEIEAKSLPSSLEKVNLSHNNMRRLPSDTFCGFKNLVQLDLSYNRFQDLEDSGIGARANKDAVAANETRTNQSRDEIDDAELDAPDFRSSRDFLEHDSGATARSNIAPGLEGSCKGSLQSLILNYNGIDRLPPGGFDVIVELQSLFMSNNEIQFVSDEAFEGLDSLQVLDLSDNRITSLSSRTFIDCVRIQKLYLRNNSLTEFEGDIFRPLAGLQILDLSWNKLTLVEENSDLFKGLRRLVILNLSHNRITSILVTLFQDLSALQRLDLSYNLLTSIDEQVFRTAMFNLYELNLSHNKLLAISSSSLIGLVGLNILNLNSNSLLDLHPLVLLQSSNLRQINLANNKFENIPAAVQNLSFLNHLDVSHNNILKLESYNFDRLSNLHVVNLSSNIISNITSKSFHGLKTLKILDLSDNNINNIIEGSLDSIAGLKYLYLSRNKLTNINGLFAGMETLEELHLSENFITMFDYAFLPRQLIKLVLRKNKIKQLGNYFKVHNVLALEEIDASFNNIQIVNEVSLPNTIQKVYLEQNKIREVKPGTFREKLNISLINLRMNQISKLNPKSVSPEWITKNQKKAVLYLGGNSLVCDCEMEWLFAASINSNQYSENPETNHRLPVIGDVSDSVCTLPHSIGNVTTYAKIIHTSPEDYLCPYTTHCFATCHCCDFIACDCQMKCPTSCSCFHDDTWAMNLVDCSRGSLDVLPSKIPMDATVVLLDGNNLRVLHAHHFIGRHSIQKLYLNNSNIQTLQNRTFHGLLSLKYLFLQDNMIVQLNGFEFSGLAHLKELHLQNNRISFLPNNTFVGLKMLEVLRIDNNFILDFPVWHLSRNLHLKSIYLSNNPWDCNCEFTGELSRWVHIHGQLVVKPEELTCALDNSRTTSVGIMEPNFVCALEKRDITHQQFGQREVPFIAGGICGGIILMATLVIVVMIVTRRKAARARKLGLSASSSYCQEEDGKVFDAYICYSIKDTSFVRDVLASKLENGHPSFKLCLHNRDYGENSRLAEFVTQSICFSRKIILVISNSFADDEWKDTIFRRTIQSNLRNLESSLIVVNFDGVSEARLESDLKLLVRKANKVNWGDKYFWKKLGELLPPKSVYSSFSLYISDPLYKSPAPLLSPPRVTELPSSSSVLTNTTGLTTPSEGGRASFHQEQPASYKAPPPPRPCQQHSCDYLYKTIRDCNESLCSCQIVSKQSYSSIEGASVHTYGPSEVLSHSTNDRQQSSPESHHYSVINVPVSLSGRKSRRTMRQCRSSQGSPGSYDNVISSPVEEMTVTPCGSFRQRSSFKSNFRSSDEGEDGFESSSSSSGKFEATNEEFDQPSPTNIIFPGFLSEECFV